MRLADSTSKVALKTWETRENALDGIETVSRTIARYIKVEDIYIVNRNAVLDESFEKDLVNLYVSILEYQVSVAAHFRKSRFKRFVEALPGLDDHTQALEKVRE